MSQIAAESVCIVRHENYLPPTAKSPAVGIKDGLIRRKELSGGAIELSMTVLIVLWCQIIDPDHSEASLTGVDDLDGILSLANSLILILDHNLLDIHGIQSAFASECRASEPMGINTTTLQKKTIVMNYVKEIEGACGD